MKQIRQGDVLLVLTTDEPQGKVVEFGDGRIVLAYGEVTGHAHVVEVEQRAAGEPKAKLIESKGGNRYLVMEVPGTLVHQEHSAAKLDPGTYKVIRQREWTDREERIVRD
jgi:hypothetical protein